MPIYEYVCSDCGLKFELLRPFSESSKEASCPQCHKNAERIISACASFSKSEAGESISLAGTDSSCSSCGTTSCTTCGF